MQFKPTVPRKLNRRDFIKLAGLTGAGTIPASCTSESTPSEAEQAPAEEEAEPEAPSGEKIPLSFWTPGGSDVYCKGFDTIAENYMAENPNILVETPTQCNPTGENYSEVLLANIAAGTPPDSTIVWTSPVTYAVRNAVLPLDDYMAISKYSQKGKWPEGVFASCLYKGVSYGLPVTAGTYAVFYNEELFEKMGLSSKREDFPKTWDDRDD